MKTIQSIFNKVDTVEINGNQELKVDSLEYDSRKVKEGTLFFALEGIHTDGHEYIEMIINSSENAARLSNRLLTFSRKETFNLKVVELESLICDSIVILETMVDKKVTLDFTPQNNKLTSLIDYSSIQNALMNICINSSHAMPEGGPIKIILEQISLNRDYCNNSVYDIKPGLFSLIKIVDRGSGIDEDIIERIFDPFFTTKDKGEGTGLGLAAAKQTVIEHKGEMKVMSKPGMGTEMRILLPSSLDQQQISPLEDKIFYGKGNILLVDDEEINRTTGREILQKLGYTVYLATNGLEGVNMIREQTPQFDAVIIDMIMPIMDGSEAFYKIKEMGENIKIILCSGYAQENKVDSLIKNGLNGIIYKPFRIAKLSKILSDCLIQ